METTETSPHSHPDQPVRHSYPLAIEKAGFGTAMDLLIKTFPYALVRFGILVAVSIIKDKMRDWDRSNGAPAAAPSANLEGGTAPTA